MAGIMHLGRVALSLIVALAGSSLAHAQIGQFDRAPVVQAEEDSIITPPGYSEPGHMAKAPVEGAGKLRVRIVDATGNATLCRVNVVGPDGQFYQPADNPFAPYGLLGPWPEQGQGNRPGKAPIRYFGHFFYTAGEFTIGVPAGKVRIEAWKGFEFRPATAEVEVAADGEQAVELKLERAVDPAAEGYYGGDTHLHFVRGSDAEEKLIFDLLEAEDVRFGIDMCYNETDRYEGRMATLVMPQYRGLGRRSVNTRGAFHLVSGQEYRNAVYGHLNLFWRDDLALDGQSLDPNGWPVFGLVAQQTKALGGYAFYAHGGYAQEIYADLAHGAITGVELLQFGIYRGIGLEGWYHVLNAGLSCPAVGASDYPACRKMSDCRTYVKVDGEVSFERWLLAAAAGRSFITSAPMLYLEIDGQPPGSHLERAGAGPHRVVARVRVQSPTAPVMHVQVIVNGQVVRESQVDPAQAMGHMVELAEPVEMTRSSWIAARAYSKSATGNADAEAHTNPVYVDVAGKLPYAEADVRWLIARIDEQIAQHRERKFDRSGDVVAYFEEAKAKLQKIIDQGGLQTGK